MDFVFRICFSRFHPDWADKCTSSFDATEWTPAPKCSSHALSKQLHSDLPAGGCETAKHHGTEGWKRRLARRLQCLTLPSEPTRNQLQSAAPMPSKQLHSDVPASGSEIRFGNSKTPWHWRTEAAPSKQAPVPNVAFWADKKPAPKCSSHALSKQLHSDVPAGGSGKQAPVPNVASWANKKPAPKCSSHALKAAPQRPPSGRFRNSKTPWHWRTEAAPSKQAPVPNVAFWTDKKPASKCSSHALKTAPQRPPSGRLRNSKTPWHWRTEAAPSKQAPVPNVAFWADKKPAPKWSSHALKAAPQRPPSGRLRNSKTPWHWRTEAAPSKQAPVPNVAFWADKKPAPKCSSHALSKQLHSDLPAGGCETAKNHGTEGRKRRLASRLQCLTLPSEPTRNQLQSAAPMPSQSSSTATSQRAVPKSDSETAKHHGTEGRLASRLQCLTLPSEPTRNPVCLSLSVCLSACLSVCLCVRRILLRRAPPASGWGRRIFQVSTDSTGAVKRHRVDEQHTKQALLVALGYLS